MTDAGPLVRGTRPIREVGRRGFIAGAAGFTAALAAGGAEAQTEVEVVDITDSLIAEARREGQVTVRYSSPVDEMQQMARAFEQRFGIRVQIDRRVGVLGTQQFATESRAGRHIMDVNYTADPPGTERLANEGLYLRYTLKDLASKLDPGAYLPNLGYSPKWTEIVISYNPDLIPHERARELFSTWDGLLDPSLRGRIGINEPAGGGVPFATFLMFYRTPRYGRAFLEKLAAQRPRLYPGSAPGRENLAAGAISVFIPNWESIAMIQFEKGDKTAWTYPDIAPAFANTYFAISKTAPRPAAARLFSAWFFTEEGARVMHTVQARPTLKGVPDDRSSIEALRRTSWWRPYPDNIRWVPDTEDWEASYATLMPDMRRVLGWRG